jgi:AcrR family transcriptional regulator
MASKGSERVPRGTLTRARIVEAGVALADEEGLSGLSMPKLARHLGVGVMSLYSHVASKDDLLDDVAQKLLEQLKRPSASGISAVREHFRALRRLLVAHPGLAEVLATRGVAVPAVFDLLEQNLTCLLDAGIDGNEAVGLYYALLTYTLGFATWQLPRAAAGDRGYRRRWRELVADLPVDQYPSLHALRDRLAAVASDAQFEFGLERLTVGLDG